MGWGPSFPEPNVLVHAFGYFTNLHMNAPDSMIATIGVLRQIWDIIKGLATLRDFAVSWDHIECVNPALLKQIVKPELRKLALHVSSLDSLVHLVDCFRSAYPMSLVAFQFQTVRHLSYRMARLPTDESDEQAKTWQTANFILERFFDAFRHFSRTLCNIKCLTLGALQPYLDEPLFRTLAQIPRLENLCLEYEVYSRDIRQPYDPTNSSNRSPQQSHPTPVPTLATLKRLTLRYDCGLEL